MKLISWFKAKNNQRLSIQRKISYSLLKKLIKPKKHKNLNIKEVHSICIWCYEGIGDAIFISGFINKLQELGMEITICSSPRNVNFCKTVLKLEHCYSVNELLKITNHFDLIFVAKDNIQYREGKQLLKIFKKAKVKYIVGFDDPLDLYDISIKYAENNHITKKFEYVLDYLWGGVNNLIYKLHLSNIIEKQVIDFIYNFKNKIIVCLNAFAGDNQRSFTVYQVEKITRYLSRYKEIVVIMIGSQEQMKVLSFVNQDNVLLTPPNLGTISHALAFIKHADLVITPDTSIVHIANAFNKNMICVYNNKKSVTGLDCNIIYGPNYSNCVQLFTKDNLGTTDGDPVSDYDVSEIFPYIKKFLTDKEDN